MSVHADTISTLADTVQRWKASHDALVAENQRLRDALEQIGAATEGKNPMIVGVSVSQIAGFARAALDAMP